MTRTLDQIADELTAIVTARIDACASSPNGVEVRIDGYWMHIRSEALKTLIEREFWQEYQRGIRSSVLQQVLRNITAWARFGPPAGADDEEAV